MPAYWTHRNRQWQAFTLHGELSVDANTPVRHVRFFEADAFAR